MEISTDQKIQLRNKALDIAERTTPDLTTEKSTQSSMTTNKEYLSVEKNGKDIAVVLANAEKVYAWLTA